MNSYNYNNDSSELSLDDIVTEYDRQNSDVNVSEVYNDIMGGGVKMWMAKLGDKANKAKAEFSKKIKDILKMKDERQIRLKLQSEKKNLMERCKQAGIESPTIANCTENEIKQKKLQLLRDEQCEKNQIKDKSGKVLQGEGKCTEFIIHQNTIQGIYNSQCKDLYNNGEGMVNEQNGMAQGPADCNKFTLAQYREQLKKDEECAAMGMKDEKGQVAKGPDDCNDITIKHNRKMDKKGASNKILLDKCVELGIYTEAEKSKIKFNRDFEIRCNKKTIKAAEVSAKNQNSCEGVVMPDGKPASGDVYCSPKAVKAYKSYTKAVEKLEKKRTKDCGKLQLKIEPNKLIGLASSTDRNCDNYEIISQKEQNKLEKQQKKLDSKCQKIKLGTGSDKCNSNTYPIGLAQSKLDKKCKKYKLGNGPKQCNPATLKEAKKFSGLLKKCKKLAPYTGQTSETCTEELIEFAKKQVKLDKKCKKLGIDETKCTNEAIEDHKAKKKAWKTCQKINKHRAKQGKPQITEKDCVPIQMNIMKAIMNQDKKFYKMNKKECKKYNIDDTCKLGAEKGMAALNKARLEDQKNLEAFNKTAAMGSAATATASKKYNWLTQLTETDSYALTDVEEKLSALENILDNLN